MNAYLLGFLPLPRYAILRKKADLVEWGGGAALRSRIKLFFFFLILFTAVVALGFGALLLGIFPIARPYTVQGPVIALSLPVAGEGGLQSALDGEMDAQQAEDTLRPLVAQAAAAGANTLLVELSDTEDGRVLFEDEQLSPLLEGVDLLKLLCRLAKESGIQTFALADPAMLAAQGGETGEDLSAERCSRLLRRYPIAGLILSADGQSADAAIALGRQLGRPRGGRTLGLLLGADAAPDPAAAEAGFSLLLVQGADLQRLADWRAACPDAALLPAAGAQGPGGITGLLRELCYEETLEGALLGDLDSAVSDPGSIGLLVSYFDDPVTAQGFALPRTLTLSYPADGAVTTAESIVLLGLSDPTLPLTISAQTQPRRSAGGAFAAEVQLEEGQNELTVSQPGGESLTVTVVYKKPVPSSGSLGPKPDTRLDDELSGRYIEVTAQLASALTDPGSDGAIAMTLRQGARARILGSVETVRSGEIVSAYLLASGDYLLCSNAQLLEEDAAARLTAPEVTEEPGGALTIALSGGTPLCYDRLADGRLVLELYDAVLDFDPALLENAFVDKAQAEPIGEEAEGTRLILTLSQRNPLWGYDLSYAEGQTLLYLRGAPVVSGEMARPLAGVTVLLDPGHGGTDPGALGIGGGAGVPEKEVNLALALAVRDRLQQLGATVEMTRAGDDTLTLQQRWEAAERLRPDFFLSLHHNSTALITDSGAAGVEAYYFEPGSAGFAAALLDAVSGATGRAADDPIWDYFYVTRMTCAPAVLFEFGYLVDPEEFEGCVDSGAIRAAADGVAEGLIRCLAAP